MQLTIEDNECTIIELAEYIGKLYGATLNGSEITSKHINRWRALKRIPAAYGGNSILKERFSRHLGYVLTVEGFTRDMMEYAKTVNIQPVNKRTKRPQKKRTRAYYQALKGAYRNVSPDRILPDNWKQIGIRRNQFK
jgi:hypothetical protein